MIEIPESNTLANQLTQTIQGKTVLNVTANYSPHKFAWYFGDPANYHSLLSGKQVGSTKAVAGYVEILVEDCRLLLNDGVNLRYYAPGEELPKKHQLKIEFDDESALVCAVQMYGGLCAFPEGANDNPYYLVAKEKPSPLSDEFNEPYFDALLAGADLKKLSAKAFLATEQRIPGLGNGVLQDILWQAKIHPKRKMASLNDTVRSDLFHAVKSVLFEMTLNGGRDTERDLFGCPGGYKTVLSKNTVGRPCPVCGGTIQKEAYLGGSIYFCAQCQHYEK